MTSPGPPYRWVLSMPTMEGKVAPFVAWVRADLITDVHVDPMEVTYRDEEVQCFASFMTGKYTYCSTYPTSEELMLDLDDPEVHLLQHKDFNYEIHKYHARNEPPKATCDGKTVH